MKSTRVVSGAALAAVLLTCGLGSVPSTAWAAGGSFLKPLHTITPIASTVPANGDQNPYGVAVVRHSIGALVTGNILVSNFNNSANLQGTGTTIMQISPNGTASVFAQISATSLPGACPGGIGLTTALVVLRSGWVIVGSLPTTDGTAATAQAGCLLVVSSTGQVVQTIHGDPINGPWDMTAVEGDDQTTLFVTNVLNGTVAGGGTVVKQGTVVRIGLSVAPGNTPKVLSETIIGSEFPERTDPNALVIGPTGVGFGEDGTLYIADTLANRIAAIDNALLRQFSAGTGTTVSQGVHLKGPLGLAIAPNGNLLTVNGNDRKMVETTPQGDQVAVRPVDTTHIGAGTLFGLAVEEDGEGVYFVNDGNNMLDLLH
ncbi:MAG TPA: hypothetical protein VEH53_01890 [archaeon]|nr:hypothetical protein [archaeon]